MTTETASLLCPAAMSETHADKLSERYIHLNTSDIVKRFIEADSALTVTGSWNRTARKGMPEHAAHTVTISHTGKGIPDPRNYSRSIVPQVIIENSHNGTGSLRFVLGLFAQVCSNGLCIAYGDASVYKHPHLNRREETFGSADAAAVLVDLFGKLEGSFDTVRRMADMQLTASDREAFARDIILLRWPERVDKIDADAISSALETRRMEDATNAHSLWNTFNILQENVCGGAVRFNRKSRKLTNVLRHNALNLALWNRAELLLN